jgi:hypothetical protein
MTTGKENRTVKGPLSATQNLLNDKIHVLNFTAGTTKCVVLGFHNGSSRTRDDGNVWTSFHVPLQPTCKHTTFFGTDRKRCCWVTQTALLQPWQLLDPALKLSVNSSCCNARFTSLRRTVLRLTFLYIHNPAQTYDTVLTALRVKLTFFPAVSRRGSHELLARAGQTKWQQDTRVPSGCVTGPKVEQSFTCRKPSHFAVYLRQRPYTSRFHSTALTRPCQHEDHAMKPELVTRGSSEALPAAPVLNRPRRCTGEWRYGSMHSISARHGTARHGTAATEDRSSAITRNAAWYPINNFINTGERNCLKRRMSGNYVDGINVALYFFVNRK